MDKANLKFSPVTGNNVTELINSGTLAYETECTCENQLKARN